MQEFSIDFLAIDYMNLVTIKILLKYITLIAADWKFHYIFTIIFNFLSHSQREVTTYAYIYNCTVTML